MRSISHMMVVKFDRPREMRTEAGIILPAANTNLPDKEIKTERFEGEWWPETGTVIIPPARFRHGYRGTGEFMRTADNREVEKQEHAYHQWELPREGDKVVFGYKDVNVLDLDNDGHAWVEVAKAWCVISPDGTRRANGPWCVVEQVPEEMWKLGLLTGTVEKSKVGIGVARMAGDGFLQAIPSVVAGLPVRFMVHGNQNPEIPNPFGDERLTRIKAQWVTGIGSRPVDEAWLQSLKDGQQKAKEAMAVVSGPIGVETEDETKARRQKEAREKAFRDARKGEEKRHIGSQRRVYGWR